ncbi:EI24 domain-containing protein [Terricaulis sp.]|uniref:EI24 domain-containing protein n=1 Tax=Terricaulis sp. TaxID=2768686 RepID=UPI0037832509
MGRAVTAIGGALKDVLFGRLTLLALVNLVLAGAIAGSSVIAAIHYIQPLIPHASGWLGWAYDTARFLFGAGSIVLGVALSPAASMFVGGLLFDFAAERVEKGIGAPQARKPKLLEGLVTGIRVAIPSLLLNILFAPIYFIPGINVFVFYSINGYLMGRDYAMLAALRRLPFKDALRLRRSARFSVFIVGVACALIPFVGPLIGASGMTRLVNTILTGPSARR